MAAEPELHAIVDELRERRRSLKISVADVARLAAASVMTIRRLERGDVVPSIDMLERYASAVGASLRWLVDDLEDDLEAGVRPGRRVNVAWGLDEPMSGTVLSVHGTPDRLWLRVELDDGPTIDVPSGAVEPRRRVRRTEDSE